MGKDTNGWDCTGLVRYVLRERFGVETPDYSFLYRGEDCIQTSDFERELLTWRRVAAEEMPGDVLFLMVLGLPHVALVTGGGYMLHARKKMGTLHEPYRTTYWLRRIQGAFRWPTMGA